MFRLFNRLGTGMRQLMCVVLLLGSMQASGADTIGRSAWHDYRVVPVLKGLVRPWSLAFLPGGEMLVTEKAGFLRSVQDGELLDSPVSGLPEIVTRGQAGLMDIALHPEFTSNRIVYLSYSKKLAGDKSTTAVLRGVYENGRLQQLEEVFEAKSQGRGHYGSRLAFDNNGHLFITVGDRQARPKGRLSRHPAQDLSSHQGVVVRLTENGQVPPDNPFVDKKGALPEIWSYGHRNPQGMVFDSATGRLWATEHGPQGGDELNLIKPGGNFGWPVIGFGVNYGSGKAIHESTTREGMLQPVKVWVPSIATSGLALYRGDPFPNWTGHLLAGGLSGERVALLELDGSEVVREETLVLGLGRVRDIRVGADGLVYLLIDTAEESDWAIYRLEPEPRTEVRR